MKTLTSTRIRRSLKLGAFALIGATALSASAGLYPPAAPPDSAFLRVFNNNGQGKLKAQVGDKAVPDAAPLDASSYVFLAPGQYPVKISGAEKTLSLSSKRCYTAANSPEGIQLFDQDCFNSQLKSLVSVYNLIEGATLSVKAGAEGPAVIDKLGANTAGHREVNPVKANLVVFNGGTQLAEAKPVTLERGKVFSLFVTGTVDAPVLTWVVN